MKKVYSALLVLVLMFSMAQTGFAKNIEESSVVETVEAYYDYLSEENFEAVASLTSEKASISPEDVVWLLSYIFDEYQIDIVDYKIKKVEADPNNANYVNVTVKLVETVYGEKTILTEQVTLTQDGQDNWKIVTVSVLKQNKK